MFLIPKSLILGTGPQTRATIARVASGVQPRRHLTQEQIDKHFVDKPSPYTKPERKCILCKHKIEVDYKNPRLLSQFLSPLNGRIYEKHITGLCEKQQTLVRREIIKSRKAMLMPVFYKNPKYNRDPPLFNIDRPQRPNPY